MFDRIYKAQSEQFLVELIKLDDFVLKKNIEEVDLLKVDTEGNELKVLKGFENFIALRKVNAVHFEFNVMNVVSRVFMKDFYDGLEGYDFFRMLPDALVPLKEYNPVFCEIFAFQKI